VKPVVRLRVIARHADCHDDPDAPEVNSRVPSVNVVVADDNGRVLMIRRRENGNWALPGGGINLGESLPEAGVRETAEETGVTCEITGIVGTYADPKHVILYTSNGEATLGVLHCPGRSAGLRGAGYERRSVDVRWVSHEDLLTLHMDHSMRMRVEHDLSGVGPYTG